MASAPNQSSVYGMCASLSATGSWRSAGHSASTASFAETTVLGSASSAAASVVERASITVASSARHRRRRPQHEHQQRLCGPLRELPERVGEFARPTRSTTAGAVGAGFGVADEVLEAQQHHADAVGRRIARQARSPGVSSSWNSWW